MNMDVVVILAIAFGSFVVLGLIYWLSEQWWFDYVFAPMLIGVGVGGWFLGGVYRQIAQEMIIFLFVVSFFKYVVTSVVSKSR